MAPSPQEPITLDEVPDASRWGVGARAPDEHGLETHPALVIAWSMRDPSRVGESCVFASDGELLVVGRGPGEPGDPSARAAFVPRRPGKSPEPVPLAGATLSRRHVEVKRRGDDLVVENHGRTVLEVDGDPVTRADLGEGSTMLLGQELLFVVDRRPLDLGSAPSRGFDFAFGRADAQGLVGETAEAWAVRDRVRFAAGASTGVLVTGSAGSGRETVGLAVLRLSSARERPIVSIDGRSLRLDDLESLLRREDQPSLLIDELADVGAEVQAALIRYTGRIASRPPPRSPVIATTKGPERLKPALTQRFPVTLRVPDLDERRADIPLIARELLRRMARQQPEIGARFFEGWDEAAGTGEPRLSPTLAMRLLVNEWPGNLRELESVLWRVVLTSGGGFLDVTPEVDPLLPTPRRRADTNPIEAHAVREALKRANGRVADAARYLGLRSRFQLYRLMEKHEIRG